MATDPYKDSPVTVEERYQGAASTSDLTIFGGMVPKDHKAGQGEVVAAAGMAAGRLKPDGKGGYVLLAAHPVTLGMALLRLHSEFSASAKPRKVGREVIEKLAQSIKESDARNNRQNAPGSAMSRAKDEAQRWYTNELRILATRLKSRPEVMAHLTDWAAVKGIAPETVGVAVHYWLSSTCPACDGHGLRYVEHQATRQCHDCGGTGNLPLPDGAGRILRHINYSLDVARGALSKRLRRG
jgi:hypothetical protein